MAAPMSIFRKNLFRGKSAVVTGGGTGIGRAIATELIGLGCKVLIASRKEDRLRRAAEEIKQNIPPEDRENIQYTVANIRNEEQVETLMKTCVERFGSLDLLVNNGGGQFITNAENMTLKGWNAVIETNLTGTYLCCKHAFYTWMEKHSGSIVNIIADIHKGIPLMSHTAAARGGVQTLTRTLAIEWVHYGIRVNAVAPGVIYSDTANENYSRAGLGDEFLKSMSDTLPAKRLGRPEEVASMVCYLLSPGASYVSGATYYVDGGSSLYSSRYQVPADTSDVLTCWTLDSESLHSKM